MCATLSPVSWVIVARQQRDPWGGLHSAWGMTRQVAGNLGFFNVALDHMRCDVGRDKRGGLAYLYRLLGGGMDVLGVGRRSGQAVGNGRSLRGHLLLGRGLRVRGSAAGR